VLLRPASGNFIHLKLLKIIANFELKIFNFKFAMTFAAHLKEGVS
jgi:hypothetical protein